MKTRTLEECYEAIHVLAELGHPILLGHDRVQKARNTITAIRRVEGAELHLINPLQPNEINHALGCVGAIEPVDCPILVEKINVRANRETPIFPGANVLGEETKHGCHPGEVDALVNAVLGAEHLGLCGFMTVDLNSPIERDVRAAYAQSRPIYERAEAATGLRDPELSVGASADPEWAIAEEASIVRIGIAVFGERRPRD